ncbi:hypothetical protein ACJX0J_014523, partial [Zea mays]
IVDNDQMAGNCHIGPLFTFLIVCFYTVLPHLLYLIHFTVVSIIIEQHNLYYNITTTSFISLAPAKIALIPEFNLFLETMVKDPTLALYCYFTSTDSLFLLLYVVFTLGSLHQILFGFVNFSLACLSWQNHDASLNLKKGEITQWMLLHVELQMTAFLFIILAHEIDVCCSVSIYVSQDNIWIGTHELLSWLSCDTYSTVDVINHSTMQLLFL